METSTITLSREYVNELESSNYFGQGYSESEISATREAWVELMGGYGAEIDADEFDAKAQAALDKLNAGVE